MENFEKNAVVKNQGTKTACTKNSWRSLAMGKPTGSVWKETIAVSATMRTKRGKVTPSNPSQNSFHATE